MQDIPKETPKGSLYGLQEWDKGEVCAEMCMPPPSDTPVMQDPGETLCIKQWGKCKSLTYNCLDEIWPGVVKNVLKIFDPNCILPDVSTAKVKGAVALSLLLYAIKYLSDMVKASCRTLHPDLKDVEVWVMAQRLLFLKKEAGKNPLADGSPRCPFVHPILGRHTNQRSSRSIRIWFCNLPIGHLREIWRMWRSQQRFLWWTMV